LEILVIGCVLQVQVEFTPENWPKGIQFAAAPVYV